MNERVRGTVSSILQNIIQDTIDEFKNVLKKNILHKHFLYRLFRNILVGILLCAFSLVLGILGYHKFEHLSWLDSFVNAAMILSGMGPLGELHFDAGKLFAGSYALFSGVIFLIIVSLILSPVMHWILAKFHLENK